MPGLQVQLCTIDWDLNQPARISSRRKCSGQCPGDEALTLPASVDLNAGLPPVGDQGNQGSCTCWSSAYYNKTYLVGLEKGWDTTLSTHQFSPAFVYNQINGGVDEGAEIGDAMQLMVDKGCDTLYYFPYSDANWTKQPTKASLTRALAYQAYSWNTLPLDLSTIKSYLAQGHPLVFGVAIYPDFETLTPSHPVYSSMTGTLEGYHALCIIGYNDSKKAVKFVNSWGSDWGTYRNDSDPTQGVGYGWISYGLLTNKNFYCEVNLMLDASSSSSSSSSSSAKSVSSSSISSKSSSSSSSSSQNSTVMMENLDNFPSTAGTYSNGSFNGTQIATWTFTQCRGDIIISGKTPCLGKDRSPNSQLASSTVSGGLKTLAFDYEQAFSSPVKLDVYVNSTIIATVTTTTGDQNVIKHFGPLSVNYSGDFTLSFIQESGGGQVCVDNIQWNSY